MASPAPLPVAVVGAGYWGPNLVRNFRAARTGTWSRLRPGPATGRQARCRPGRGAGRAVLDELLDPRRRRRGRDRDAGPHAPRRSPWPRCAPASTCWSRSRWRTTGPTGRAMVEDAERARPGADGDHTYCYTPAVLKIRELVAAGELGDILFVDSVRINLGLVQPDVDVFWDLAPHDLSILDFILPGGLRAGRGGRARRRPARRRPGLRRLPDAAAGRRRHGPRARQLAEPDQDPPDGHRRLPAHPGLGRPEPAAAAQRLRPRGRPDRAVAGRRRTEAASHLLPARRHGRRRCPSTRRWARWSAEFAAASAQRAPRHGPAGPGCGCCPCSRPSATSLSADGAAASAPGSRRTPHSWRQSDEHACREPRVLVTGGAGTIGSTIVDQLLDAGAGQVDVLDNLVRGRRANLADGAGQRPGRAGRGRHPRPRPRPRPDPGQGPGLPPGGHPDHPVRRGAPAGPRGAGRRHLQRARGGGRAAGSTRWSPPRRASVYGLAEQFPTDGAPPPLQQRHVLRRGQVVQRGHAAQLPARCTGSTTCCCATSTSTGRGWTSTASTPRCWSAGWSASRTASRR